MNSCLKLLAPGFCAGLSILSTSAQTPLVNHSDTWRWHKGNAPLQSNWKTVADASLDATWFSSAGGFGYSTDNSNETNQCKTVLSDMRNTYTTLYMRKQFQIDSEVDTNQHLLLTMDFDDGFIAWLDGSYLISANVTGAPNEPATNALASATHESSRGNSMPINPPTTYDLGPVGTRLGVGTHTLAIIGLNQSSGSSDLIQIADLFLGSAGCPPNSICSDTNWTAANSPYIISSTLTVAAGATLTIEPGVTVLFNQGLGMTINGRLIAEGTPADHIVFTRNAGASSWNQIAFTANSSTSRLAHAEMDYFAAAAIEATGTTLYLDSIVWTNSTAAVVDLHSCSVTLLNSYIPGGAGNEPVHFSTMPANGHALVKGCVFGAPRGYNDSVDFTGGNRPGAVVQFIDNIFLAAVDDCFDMDGTDAHIEGNIFLNVRKDASRASSSNPITTGANGSDRSQLVICRNIFYNCEHTFMEKDHGMAILQNNTILRLTPNPLSNNTDPDGNEAPGIIMFGEPWRNAPYGDGAIFEGNIAADLQLSDPWPILASAQAANASFLFVRNYNCIQGFNQPGIGNINGDPLFVGTGNLTAANIRQMLALQPGSPCRGTGPNGLDMGALVPAGASISGAPASPTTNTSVTLKVAGPGIWAYRWRLNGGSWSSEVSLVPQFVWNGQPFTADIFSNAPPITLSNLTDGAYSVEVIGKNSAGFWQETNAAASVAWTVATSAPLLIENASRMGNTVSFTFIAQAGQTYSVLFRDALDAAHPWTKLADVPAQGSTGPYPVMDNTATGDTRFYRIVTPAQP
jgi:hypothetical protein